MNKKAEAYPIEKVVGILILLTCFVIVFLAFFAPEEGWLNKIAETAESWARFIPGRDELPNVGEYSIPEEVQEFYDDLYDKFEKLSELPGEECWINYTPIPNLKKYEIVLEESKKGDGAYMWILHEGRRLDNLFVPNIKPCIIAGKARDGSDAAENFHSFILLSSYPRFPQLGDNIYNELSSLTIEKKGKLITKEGDSYNIDYGYLLYKHNPALSSSPTSVLSHICFMPYRAGNTCKSSENALRKGCIDKIKSISEFEYDKGATSLMEILQKPFGYFYNYNEQWSYSRLEELCKHEGIEIPNKNDI